MSDAQQRYQETAAVQFQQEELVLGAPTSYSILNDPKHVAFVLSRYKFCSKMLQGKSAVIEIGCGDGIGLPLIAKTVGHVYCVDWGQEPLDSIRRRLLKHLDNVTLVRCDVTRESLNLKVDAAFSIDFLEHIDPAREAGVMKNIIGCLPEDGVLITGTPNVTAQPYASRWSAVQHTNLKGMDSLRSLMEEYFENVFMFGMNDEVLHTGYAPMCHYLWSVAAGLKKRTRG